jgi:filamentous hemagglutinin family protein
LDFWDFQVGRERFVDFDESAAFAQIINDITGGSMAHGDCVGDQ